MGLSLDRAPCLVTLPLAAALGLLPFGLPADPGLVGLSLDRAPRLVALRLAVALGLPALGLMAASHGLLVQLWNFLLTICF